jgi:hypothetical protein
MLSEGELNTLIGVSLDGVATFTGAVGKMLLRHAAVTGNCWYYPLGFFFTAMIDPAFDASAYSFAAGSIITACAGLVIVWTVILAPCFLGEPLTPTRAWSALLICVGTLFTGVFGNHEEVERSVDEYLALFTRPAACGYYVVLVVSVLVCWARSRATTRPEVKGFYLSALAGLLAGNTFTTKACVEMLECVAEHEDVGCDQNPFYTPWPYLLFCCTLFFSGGSLLILGYAELTCEALMAITVFEGCMIISGAVAGNVVLDEAAGQSWVALSGYTASFIVILIGLGVLFKGELAPPPSLL